MPFQVRVHAGTVNIASSDFDGYATPAVQGVGDTGVVTINISDSTLGATRYDAAGTQLAWGTASVQASKANNVAPDRVNLSLTRVKLDPDVETHSGHSIRVGSSVLDQFTQASVSFSEGAGGTPTVQVFEDYPTIRGAGAIASAAAVGTPTLRAASRISPAGVPTAQAVGTPTLIGRQLIITVGFDQSDVGEPTLVQGAPPGLLVAPTAIGSAAAVGAPTLLKGAAVIAPGGVASREAVGTPRLSTLAAFIRPAGVPSREAVGTPAIGIFGRIAPAGVPSSAAIGRPTLRVHSFVAPPSVAVTAAVGTPKLNLSIRVASITTREAVGQPTLRRSAYLIEPTGAPSGELVGTPFVRTRAVIGFAGRIDSGEAVGRPTLSASSVRTIKPFGVPTAQAVGTPDVLLHLGTHEAIGPLVTSRDVETAITNQLKLFMDAYITEHAAQHFQTRRLPAIQSWQRVDEASEWEEAKMPGISVMVDEERSLEFWDDQASVTYPGRVLIVASASTPPDTRRLVEVYATLVRALLQHHGVGGSLKWTSTTYDLLGEAATNGVALLEFSIIMDDVFARYSDMATPPPVGSPPPDDLFVHEVDVTTESV